MKKNIKTIIVSILSLSCITTIFPVFAEESQPESGCQIMQTVDEGTEENKKFIEYIEKTQEIDVTDEGVEVIYYENGDVNIVEELDDGNFVIYSPIKDEDEIKIKDNDERLIGEAIWFAIVSIKKVYEVVSGIYSFTCYVLENTGNEDVCQYINQAIIDSLVPDQTVKYEVSKYIYKDPSCPYPPNSLQCSQPQYAYYKTYLKRV